MSFKFERLAPGSLVLVTGATGFIGSAVTVELLERGFHVRGATRSVERAQPFAQHLAQKYGPGKVEFVEVADMSSAGAYDHKLAGVAGVVHVANGTTLSADYEKVVQSAESAALSLLEAASTTPTVQSFVLTASRVSAFAKSRTPVIRATVDSWADHFVDLAKNLKPDEAQGGGIMYTASKVLGERSAFDYVDKNKPHFAFNTILPDYVAGPVSNPAPGRYSTHTVLNGLFAGETGGAIAALALPAVRIVDVRDVAKMHVAALLLSAAPPEHVGSEAAPSRYASGPTGNRFWAAAHAYTLNTILATWRKAFPNRTFPADYDTTGQPEIVMDDERSTALLVAYAGRSWLPFEQTVIDNVHDAL